MSTFEFFQNFGVPGLLLGGSWLFWNKWIVFAKVTAILGVLLGLSSGVSEVVERWPRSPQLVVSPPLSPRPWAGFYADGSPVERVSAQLVNNDTVLDSFAAEAFDITERALNLQRIDNSSLRVTWKGNPQGILSSSVLEQKGFRLLPGGAFPTPRWIAMSETANGTERVAIRPDSAKRVYFSDVAASIDRYVPENDGIVLSAYGDGDTIASALISRADNAQEGQRRLQFTHHGERYGVTILFLNFRSPPDIANNNATLLFVRY